MTCQEVRASCNPPALEPKRITGGPSLHFQFSLKSKEILPPPRNVTPVSKDFNLFVTWLPVDAGSSGVFYTVQWRNRYRKEWGNVTHCRSISETICNITCVYPDRSNRFKVRVQALTKIGSASVWVNSEWIDPPLLVELAPPILHVRETKNQLVVNTSFSYPSCLMDILRELSNELQVWAVGSDFKMTITQRNTHIGQMKERNAVHINTTAFSSGNYCLNARAFLADEEGKWSNFSETHCLLLHNEENWNLVALPLLLLFILPAGVFGFLYWYKTRATLVKMPRALGFSNHKGPKRSLEFGRRELIKVDTLVCTGEPVVSENRRRPTPRIGLPTYSNEEEEEDEDDDDSGPPIPYTETLRFQKKDTNYQMAGMGQSAHDPSSASKSAQLDGGSLPDLMVLKPFVWTGWETEETSSGLKESQRSSLSEGSSVGGSLEFPDSCPTAGEEGQNVSSVDIDFLLQCFTLTEGDDTAGVQFTVATGFPKASCGRLEVTQISLLGIQDNQKDSCGLLGEVEEEEDDHGFENDCSGHGRLMAEMPLLEGGTAGGNRGLREESTPGQPKCHGYRPKNTTYISRTCLS
ncbi:interferon lambda receptor 1 [Hemicordylus capensis]|uniref:interferon lambda receptor 1 n=1 Tax=Hemicordylus capensis TaxID=884348 RepID=UPI0023042CBA|nr:interferon lambda receptor 1 [Hemicordylus capensis]